MPCRSRPRLLGAILLAAAALVAAGALGACSPATPRPDSRGRLIVVASHNAWGDLAAQLGGDQVSVTSILTDPAADPHLFQSSAKNAATIARASIVVTNGLGYDDYMGKLLSGSPSKGRVVVTVADALHRSGPDANPHLWYDVAHLPEVARAVTAALVEQRPGARAAFEANLATFEQRLRPLDDAVAAMRAGPAFSVATTERVADLLLAQVGATIRTPTGFTSSIEEGDEPSPADRSRLESLLTGHHVAVLVLNTQATSAVTQQVRSTAVKAHVPVVDVTETLPPGAGHLQDWLLAEVRSLAEAVDQ